MKIAKVLLIATILPALLFCGVSNVSAALIQPSLGMAQVPPVADGAVNKNPVSITFPLIDKDGRLITGVKTANLKLYNVMGLALPNSGVFAFTLTATKSPGLYTLKITPGAANAWKTLAYRFSFLVKVNATTNGIVEVLAINMGAPAAASQGGMALTEDQKAKLMQMLSPFPFTEN
jgi:hypothetical protein